LATKKKQHNNKEAEEAEERTRKDKKGQERTRKDKKGQERTRKDKKREKGNKHKKKQKQQRSMDEYNDRHPAPTHQPHPYHRQNTASRPID